MIHPWEQGRSPLNRARLPHVAVLTVASRESESKGEQMSHTLGPWATSKLGDDIGIYADHEHAWDFAIVRDGGKASETIANANLIAAAPELLAACELALGFFEAGGGGGLGSAITMGRLRSAVTKARTP